MSDIRTRLLACEGIIAGDPECNCAEAAETHLPDVGLAPSHEYGRHDLCEIHNFHAAAREPDQRNGETPCNTVGLAPLLEHGRQQLGETLAPPAAAREPDQKASETHLPDVGLAPFLDYDRHLSDEPHSSDAIVRGPDQEIDVTQAPSVRLAPLLSYNCQHVDKIHRKTAVVKREPDLSRGEIQSVLVRLAPLPEHGRRLVVETQPRHATVREPGHGAGEIHDPNAGLALLSQT